MPLAVSFAEEAAKAFGLGEPETLSLTLATEEIFAYLCRVSALGHIELRCRSCGYYVEQELVFQAADFNMKVFNITECASFDEQACEDETGLLIASRMVDRFRLYQEGAGLRLVLITEKAYPEPVDLALPDPIPLTEFRVRQPDPEELKLFVRLVNRDYAPHVIPRSFHFPGKVADMAACGDYHAAIASDAAGHIGGGIVWRWEGSGLVEFYGPYLFNQDAESGIALALVDSLLAATARTSAFGLISRYPTPDLPTEYFEALGSLTLRLEDGASLELPAYFRDLEEDAGSTVWAHPLLEEFLRNQYGSLCFAREIQLVRDEGESSSPFAVLSAEFDKPADRVVLQPVWWGRDSKETLVGYVSTLVKEGHSTIFFEMDLGMSWQSHFTPALVATGFEPRLVIPHAGKGDVVVFQHTLGEAP
jgi:anti-sigma regulatory factor (Ser/Thr protein kinase)